MLVKVRPSLAMMAMGLALVACVKSSNASGGGAPPIPDEQPVSIQILPVSPTAEAGGGTVQLNVQAVYANGAVEYVNASGKFGNAVTWTSDDDSVATVDASGLATGAIMGSVTVGASYRDKAATRALQVTPRVLALQLFPTTIQVEVGKTASYHAIALFEDHTVLEVAAEGPATAPTSVATVSGGDVTGVVVGTASLTAGYHGHQASAAIDVIAAIPPPTVTGIAIEGPSTLAQGTTIALSATASLSDMSTSDVTGDVSWSSSDATILTVTGGVVTPVKAGTATVKAELTVTGVATPFTAQQDVTVQGDTVTLDHITIEPAFAGLTVLPLDVTTSFTAVGNYVGGYTQDLTDLVSWDVVNASDTDEGIHASAGDPGEVSTATGLIISNTPGDVKVTAAFGSVTAEYPLTIAGLLDSIVVESDLDPLDLAVGDEPVFTATGHYKDGATDLDFTFDLTQQVAWFDTETPAELAPVVVVDNTDGNRGAGVVVGGGTSTISAWFHGFTINAETSELVPLEVSGTLDVAVP